MKPIKILMLCLVLSVSQYLAAQKYTPETVPNPKNAYQNGWISDPSGYISADDFLAITEMCNAMKQAADVELAVVMLPDMDERYYAENFCQLLFNNWGIGGAESNTGVLFFFCLGTRDIRIQTGGGMEGLLPDSKCGEILDYDMDYFSGGDYSGGALAVCKDIYDVVMTPEAQVELLLGWKAKTNELSEDASKYIAICILLVLGLSYYIYKKVPYDPVKVDIHERDKESQILSTSQTASGCLAWFFPLPMLLFYLFFRKKRKSIVEAPAPCPECGQMMDRVKDSDLPDYLNAAQKIEQELGSKKYEVWHCSHCNNTEQVSHKGAYSSRYRVCNECGAKAVKRVKTFTIRFATYSETGLGENTFTCQCCNHTFKEQFNIPKLVRSSSSSSSSSSGRSYGGSSRSSGGSWGGGRSYGGGAGRKF